MSDPNLPPGVTTSMIPGHRPQDEAAERYADSLDEEELVDFVIDSELDCRGGVIYEHPDAEGVWVMEHPFDEAEPYLPEWPTASRVLRNGLTVHWLVFEGPTAREDALAYMLAFHDDEIIEEMIERHLEEGPPEDDYEGY